MKKLVNLFILALMLPCGCSEDSLIDESPDSLIDETTDSLVDENIDLKCAKGPIPFKAEFCTAPNLEDYLPVHIRNTPDLPENYIPGGGWISGFATHMGKINPTKSWVVTKDVWLDIDHLNATGEMIARAEYEGKITASNGDYFMMKTSSTVNMATMQVINDCRLFDGTGRLKGMTVRIILKGTTNPECSTTCLSGKGYMKRINNGCPHH